MSLPTLPVPYTANFQSNLQAALEQWRVAIDAKAADDHTHGASSAVLSIVAAYANLGSGTAYGESKITADTGFRWVWVAPGVWASPDVAKATPTIMSGSYLTGGIMGGDMRGNINLYVYACSCLDSTGTIALSVASNAYVTADGTGTSVNDVYIVRYVATGLCGFKCYNSSSAGPSADATVDAWRWLGMAHYLNGVGFKDFLYKDGVLHYWLASQNAITTKAAPPADCNTSVSFSTTWTPSDTSRVSEILIGGQASSADVTIAIGIMATNNVGVHHTFLADTTNLDDDDVNCWYSKDGPTPLWIPYNGGLYWGDGGLSNTGTADLRLHAIKLRR